MKKVWISLFAASLALSMTACGSSGTSGSGKQAAGGSSSPDTSSQKKVSITLTNGKGEIDKQFQQAAKDFMAANPNIDLKVYSQAVGDTVTPFDKLTASGKTVTIAMFEPYGGTHQYKDFGIDLSKEKWMSQTNDAVKTPDGKVVGFPFAVEGFGLVYNQKVLDKAVGGTFDPWSINTRDKLTALFDKVQASGIQLPVAYQTEVWSVTNHYSSMFLDQAQDPATMMTQLENGQVDLLKNAVWNGYYDTMDLLASKKYNVFGDRPLGQYYDQAHVLVGQGKAAFLFNGDWAYDSLKAVAGDKFGFIPVPVDNDPSNPLNNKIDVGATQILEINAKASADEQAAAKKFLDWLVDSKEGQDFVVNQAQVISPFKNNPNKVTNPLGVAITAAIQSGHTMPFSTNYLSANDFMTKVGPDVQKYIDKKETRDQLAKTETEFFKSQKGK